MDYNAGNKKKMRKIIMPTCRVFYSLLFLNSVRYLCATLLQLIWILICIYFKQIELRVFFVCSFLHNFFIIDVILMDSFLCMHRVGFNVFCRSVLFDSLHLLLKNLLWKCVDFSKFTYTAMICTIVWFSSFLAV